MNCKSKLIYIFQFSIFFIFFYNIYISKLNWGTPSIERSMLVFEKVKLLTDSIPKMIEQRNRYYSTRFKVFNNKDELTFKNIKEKMDLVWDHQSKTKFYEEISLDIKYDCARAHIISTILSDEGQAIYPLANINPKKFDFDPDTFIYGGFYYFVVGISLVAAKVLGVLNITRDIAYYFFNPEQSTMIYVIVRSIGVFSLFFSSIILFFLVKGLINIKTAIFSVFFLNFSPIVLFSVLSAKPHGLSMLLLLVGLFLIKKMIEKENDKYWIFASVFLGLGAATLIVNLSFAFLLFLVSFYRQKEKKVLLKFYKALTDKRLIISFLVFFGIFSIFNYYIYIHPIRFIKFVLHQKIYSNYSVVILKDVIEFVWQIFNSGAHFLVIPIFIFGIYHISRQKDNFIKIVYVFALFFFLINFLFFRHPGVWTISYPFFAIILAKGTEKLIEKRNVFISVYVVFTLVLIFAKILYYSTFYTKNGHMIEAGMWINKNIKEGSKIGIPGGWFLPADFPSFNFFKFKLINVPTDISSEDFLIKKLPDYLILSLRTNRYYNKFNEFSEKYELVKVFEKKVLFNLKMEFLPTGNYSIYIYKLRYI